jgi:hypothetical protein
MTRSGFSNVNGATWKLCSTRVSKLKYFSYFNLHIADMQVLLTSIRFHLILLICIVHRFLSMVNFQIET